MDNGRYKIILDGYDFSGKISDVTEKTLKLTRGVMTKNGVECDCGTVYINKSKIIIIERIGKK